jgi:mannose-6-phosphate isomerase-like protein (cupin superfamily)
VVYSSASKEVIHTFMNEQEPTPASFIGNIENLVQRNDNFREVIFTGAKSQLVVMSIPVPGEVGEEVHEHVEQTLYVVSGVCKVVLNNEEHIVSGGDVVVVTPGTKHNFINVGEEIVKIITTYSPPNHIDGRVHETKEDADGDIEDEHVGDQYTS